MRLPSSWRTTQKGHHQTGVPMPRRSQRRPQLAAHRCSRWYQSSRNPDKQNWSGRGGASLQEPVCMHSWLLSRVCMQPRMSASPLLLGSHPSSLWETHSRLDRCSLRWGFQHHSECSSPIRSQCSEIFINETVQKEKLNHEYSIGLNVTAENYIFNPLVVVACTNFNILSWTSTIFVTPWPPSRKDHSSC